MLRFLPSYQAVESMRQGNYFAILTLEGFGTIHIRRQKDWMMPVLLTLSYVFMLT